MAERYFVDSNGDYLGAYDGPDGAGNPYDGETEVGSPPASAKDNWNGSTWIEHLPTAEQIKAEANRRIAASGHDWMAARETGGGAAIPQNIKDYAANIRTDCAALEAAPVADYRNDTHWTAAP